MRGDETETARNIMEAAPNPRASFLFESGLLVEQQNETALARLAHTALEHYATNAAARAAVAAIPWFGGGVDALLGTAGTNRLANRMQVFFDELHDQLGAVEERLDHAVTEEDLFDTALKAMRGALETGDRERVRILVAILVEAATVQTTESLDPEAVLTELLNLSSATLRVARQMYDEATAGWHPTNSGVPVPYSADADFHVQRLEAAGLIQVLKPAGTMGAGLFSPTRYEPTATFRRIMAMVRHEPAGAGE